eukprot:m.86973 g.86973  ORF g.86973 m.86973 type:complete len:810 (-) comp8447_c0_seq3:105-2534(-)
MADEDDKALLLQELDSDTEVDQGPSGTSGTSGPSGTGFSSELLSRDSRPEAFGEPSDSDSEAEEQKTPSQSTGSIAGHSSTSALRQRTSSTSESRRDANKEYADFSTIDWARESVREQSRKRQLRSMHSTLVRNLMDAVQGWLVVLLVGLACGVVAGCVDIAAEWLEDLREGVCHEAFWLNFHHCCWAEELGGTRQCELWQSWSEMRHYSGAGGYVFDYFLYVFLAGLFGAGCALLVKRLAPYASGSGVPEVKTILSGFIIRGYFGLWTLVTKSVGMVLAVAAGLSLGKEGPLVHVACCCGNVFCRLFDKYKNNEAKKREVLSAASAAGVSVAFGAPIGGVLFSLEEVSYFFPHKTMWRSFFAAMVAAATLGALNPFLTGKLVKFSIDYDHPWHWFELVPFALIGVFGGLYGAAFNKLNLMWCKFRKSSALGRYPIGEVAGVAIITAILSFPNLYTRSSTSNLIRELFSECTRDNRSLLCTSESQHVLTMLFLACLLKMVVTVFTFGIKVPCGLFVPSMAVGALMGRIVGELVDLWVRAHPSSSMIEQACYDVDECITPGLYAVVGAAAGLGGVTRMTVSLVVIMLELTQGLTYLVPIMLSVMVSKWIGDALHPDGIYDGHIRLNGYPFLDNKEEFSKNSVVAEVMSRVTPSIEFSVISLENTTYDALENFLHGSSFSGFPVVDSYSTMVFVGYIARRELSTRLELASLNPAVEGSTQCRFFSNNSPRASRTDLNSLGELDLADIFQTSVFQLSPNMPMATSITLFQRLGIRYAVVIDHGRLIGIMTKKDVLRHTAEAGHHDPNSISFD